VEEFLLSDSTLKRSRYDASSSARPRALGTIVYGGLAVGVLDALDAMLFFGIRNGIKPTRIFQSIASGLLGRERCISGGLKTALLGVFLHFLIAFILATVFYVASSILPLLIRHAVISGLFYGVAVYFVMNFVVLPLSAVAPRTGAIPWAVFLNGVAGHALLVGLPIALLARRSAKAAK